MNFTKPNKGEIYRHVTGKEYEILAIAKHAKTEEDMVVYREKNEETVYVGPLAMFASEYTKEKSGSSIIDFLELSTIADKITYLEQQKEDVTEEFIGIVAHSLDFVENEGTLEERYHAVLKYLKTVQKYETRRM